MLSYADIEMAHAVGLSLDTRPKSQEELNSFRDLIRSHYEEKFNVAVVEYRGASGKLHLEEFPLPLWVEAPIEPEIVWEPELGDVRWVYDLTDEARAFEEEMYWEDYRERNATDVSPAKQKGKTKKAKKRRHS